MRFLLTTALLASVAATPAFAQDEEEPALGGGYVMVIGGYDHVDDGVDRDSGAAYGAVVGFDGASGNFIFGAEGEATFASTKECDPFIPDACVRAGRDLYAGGRVGFGVGGRSIIYVKGGYTNARIEGTAGGNVVVSEELDGVRVGVGAETTAGRLRIRVEYRYSDYEQDVVRQQAVVGVGFAF